MRRLPPPFTIAHHYPCSYDFQFQIIQMELILFLCNYVLNILDFEILAWDTLHQCTHFKIQILSLAKFNDLSLKLQCD